MQPLHAVDPRVQQSQPEPRLVRAAHEFEGQMMQELLKPLHSGGALVGSGDDDSGSTGALADFASEALGKALSQAGGFGIAERIVQQVSRSGQVAGSAKVTENAHANTVLKSL